MAEQRLIDANALTVDLTYDFTGHPMNGHRKTNFANIRAMILCQPTINPEDLPIVRELRAELDNLRKEKRPTATLVKSPFGVCCSRCKTECSPQWVACPVCGAEIKKEDANE